MRGGRALVAALAFCCCGASGLQTGEAFGSGSSAVSVGTTPTLGAAETTAHAKPSEDAWAIRLDPATGGPIMIDTRLDRGGGGSGGSALSDAAAESVATAFFPAHAGLFKLRAGLDAFEPVAIQAGGGRHHVEMRQKYRGIPVEGANYRVSLSPQGQVGFVLGRMYPGIETEVKPALSAHDAIQKAKMNHGVGAFVVRSQVDLAILPHAGHHVLVWPVDIQTVALRSFRDYVDAMSGEIVSTANLGAEGR